MHTESKTKYYIIFLLIAWVSLFLHYRQHLIELYMRCRLWHTPIIVTLSTTPYRIGRIFTTLQSLYAQNIHIDMIYLNIPKHFKRDNIEYIIPAWLLQDPKVRIVRCEDYGPATKVLGLIANVKLPNNAILISVDDDIQYPKNLVLQLAYAAYKNPQSAIGLSGANPYDPSHAPATTGLGLEQHANYSGEVTILQGYAGIAYRAHFFDKKFFGISDLPNYCVQSDDIVFSFYLEMQNIKRLSLANAFIKTTSIHPETTLATNKYALQNLTPAPSIKNQACINYLRTQYPEVDF